MRATPPPGRAVRDVGTGLYPGGVSRLRLTLEFAWHHVSVRAQKSMLLSFKRLNIWVSLLLIERALSKARLEPQQLFFLGFDLDVGSA